MPYSAVSKITLDQSGKITLHVTVPGWEEGLPIEISGQATQENGAVATFYSVQEMPASGLLQVSDVAAAPPNEFKAGFPITVVARASEAWITMLRANTDSEALKTSEGSEPLHGAWKEDSAHWAVAWPGQKLAADRPPRPGQTDPSTGLLHHGTWWDRRKDESLDTVMEGRFTRLFPYLPTATFDRNHLKRLADRMVARAEPESTPETHPDPEENPGIPAAYTYLGQFVDHDLTFDPISHLRPALTPAQLQSLVDFRTPRFDLDNLYGRGPDDQPYLYDEDGLHMLLGERMSGEPFDPGAVQLPRGPGGRALIGDPRNDENRIVAQLHAIFLRFHNVVADLLGGKEHVSFKEVRDRVRWHYQWILIKDFLPTILDKKTYESVFPGAFNFVTTIPGLRENDLELMPVEFSVAAYRFGHSMIRPQYQLNTDIVRPIFSAKPDDDADLGGFRPIPANWAIDWQYFINLGSDAEAVDGRPQLSYKIDTSLVHPLGNLPGRIARDPSSLALRNLERGAAFRLPSGQQVARALGVEPLTDEQLVIGKAITESQEPPSIAISKIASGLAGNAPLWAYILSEAQVTSWEDLPGDPTDKTPIRLGPVGGRLVAEVFASLLRGDRTSYLYAKPAFKPIRAFTRDGTFGLAQLINVVLGRAP